MIHPTEIGFYQSSLKNAEGYNTYCVGSSYKDEKTYLTRMSLQGQHILISDSNSPLFNERYTWSVVSVSKNELKVSIDEPEGMDCDYFELIIVFNREKTI